MLYLTSSRRGVVIAGDCSPTAVVVGWVQASCESCSLVGARIGSSLLERSLPKRIWLKHGAVTHVGIRSRPGLPAWSLDRCTSHKSVQPERAIALGWLRSADANWKRIPGAAL